MDLSEKIKKTAYELYEKSGRQQGNELVNWLAAEKIVAFENLMLPQQEEELGLLEYKPLYIASQAQRPRSSGKARSHTKKPQKSTQTRQIRKAGM